MRGVAQCFMTLTSICILMPSFICAQTSTPTPTPVTPTPTSACEGEALLFEHWDVCERMQSHATPPPSHGTRRWYFDDCDYCRNAGNPCFKIPCTFAMYAVAECGREFHIPLWDVETGHIRIKNCTTNNYEFLRASSTGGWTASGTDIQWEDCSGVNPYWNSQITEISFSDPVALCGIYRIELIDWGGFIWELYANCSNAEDDGYMIYDNYTDARAAFTLRPELSIGNLGVTGFCPDYTVSASVTNTGCIATDVTVCVETTLGGHWEFIIPALGSGEIKTGSTPITAPSCTTPYTIIATVDCHDTIAECSETGGSAIPCIYLGTHDHSVEKDMIVTRTPGPTATVTPVPPSIPDIPPCTLIVLLLLWIPLLYSIKYK